jgi:hypothetical protein
MPHRRSTDNFSPKAVPDNLDKYREESWHLLQFIDYKVNLMNGTIHEHDKRLDAVETNVVRGKVILAIFGSSGLLAIFWKKIISLF